MSFFKQRVIEVVRLIPYGKVMSYGQVALYIGVPRAARQVGWVLNGTEGKTDLPWWRVINREGRITIDGTKFNDKELQRKLLRAEGVVVSTDFLVAMSRYRFVANETFLKTMQLDAHYLKMLIARGFI